jgi:hypothetical protein
MIKKLFYIESDNSSESDFNLLYDVGIIFSIFVIIIINVLIHSAHKNGTSGFIAIFHFAESFTIFVDVFSVFDFNSDNITIELKKRNFESTKYKDLMIGLNKIEKAQKANKDIYFVMILDDGIFSYKYNIDDP